MMTEALESSAGEADTKESEVDPRILGRESISVVGLEERCKQLDD